MNRGDNSEPDGALSWVITIEKELKRGLPSDAESPRTIDTVPSILRKVHNNAFNLEMIGIGLINQARERRLQDVDKHKLRFLNRLLERKLELHRRDKNMPRTTEEERVSNDRQRKEEKAVLLDELVEAIKTLKLETEACYQETTDFALRMAIDGCFVVELLRINYDLRPNRIDRSAIEDDPILTNTRILATVRRDLLLLENQLPFIVLEKLYEVINRNNTIDDQQAVPLEELAATFFAPQLPIGKPKARHLLDFVHSAYLRSMSKKVHKNRVKGSTAGLVLHFASELEEAGVRFKKRKGHGLLDIKFGCHTLRVPPLPIDDLTISLLLNCVAYELTVVDHPQPIFTNYLKFWTSLVNSAEDVQILHNSGIINNALGSNTEVANLLINCRAVVYGRDLGYLYDEIKKVNQYCEQHKENRCLVWWRSFNREHCSSPWTCISLFAASFLLILTMLQTIYTVYPYYRPH